MLRDYQRRAIDQLYEWLSKNDGNPVLVLPTGSGKSHIVAALCKEAVQGWSDTRILMMTHVKELVEQNSAKMREHWPNAPMGVYSAGMRSRDIDQITFASIQSIRSIASRIGHRDLVIIDESHLINNKAQGTYRQVIKELRDINPALRVIGLTATPYRLGQGLLTDGENALFDDIIESVTIRELVEAGHLAVLKSKHTDAVIDTSKVKKRGGEFIAGQLQEASDAITAAAISEIIARADGRKHWILFCTGVAHAEHCADELRSYGISAECITGATPKGEREQIIADYKAGRIQALTNADVLTTGFDAPDTDLIALLRPTMSPALYIQMVGRGMRLKSHTDHCLVLDFAGNVETHGPITGVNPPRMAGEGGGEAPAKTCPDCDEMVHTSVMKCPECGYQWEHKPKPLNLSNADIMGLEPNAMAVTDWRWRKHVSTRSGKEMVMVKYYGGLSDPVVTEYHPITHEGMTGSRALATLARITDKAGLSQSDAPQDLNHLAAWLNKGAPPSTIYYMKKGKFYDVKDRIWTGSVRATD
jgi:DNA repair protein RadD